LLNTAKPNIARVYDFLLGGKDNFAADRDEAERLQKAYPQITTQVRENRLFLARALTWLAMHCGICQFIDVGCGLPTANNTHQIAREACNGEVRVAYVDNDPLVVCHALALLASGPGVTALPGDLACPDAIFADPSLLSLIDLGRPVAVILAMVLHFFDAAIVRGIISAITRAIAPGSYVVISVWSGDDDTWETLAGEYTAGSLHNHSPAEVMGFLGDLELMSPPGLSDARDWMPGQAVAAPSGAGGHILAGVVRKR
jgi:hypothetical protein